MTISVPARQELNISPHTATKLMLVDQVDDGDALAEALVVAILALTDVLGEDPVRPNRSSPEKIARRAVDRITNMLETQIESESL